MSAKGVGHIDHAGRRGEERRGEERRGEERRGEEERDGVLIE
jgi:hypothetical protein